MFVNSDRILAKEGVSPVTQIKHFLEEMQSKS
jgi:hypothetical protein